MDFQSSLKINILFVCLGNICRSPMAQAVLEKHAQERGISCRLEIDSAGLTSWHKGELPEGRMRVHAADHGYKLTHPARPLVPQDFEMFDYIFVMDHDNLQETMRRSRQITRKPLIDLMLRFADYPPNREEVPDPYYGGPKDFELVINLCEEACPKILDKIQTAHGF